MAGLAKSPKGNYTTIIRVKDKRAFIKQFNASQPSEEMRKKMKVAGELFKIGKQTIHNVV